MKALTTTLAFFFLSPLLAQYSDDFETEATGYSNLDGTNISSVEIENFSSSSNWFIDDSNYGNNSTNALSITGGNVEETLLVVLPSFDVQTMSTDLLSMYAQNLTTANGIDLDIMISTTGGEDFSKFSLLGSIILAPENNHQNYTFDLSAYVGSTVNIGILAKENNSITSSNGQIFVDDIEITTGTVLNTETFKSPQVISLFPNPVTNRIYFETTKAFEKYSIIDILGRKIVSGNTNNNTIDTSDLDAGVYILKLYTDLGNEIVMKKFIKK